MYKRLVLFVTLISLSVVLFACTGLDDGRASYKRGGHVGADEEFKALFDGGNASQERGNAVSPYRDIKALAEHGDAAAQYKLGDMYLRGEGVPKDYGEAEKWYRQAAEQGNADAQHNLATMYRKGDGVLQDYAEAIRWYRKAAEQGLASSQYNLGWMYSNGVGVAKDEAEAIKWYRKAAEQGDTDAQCSLGVAYTTGQGVPQNDAEAIRWFHKAAERGNATAQHNLEVMNSKDQGVLKGVAEAMKWQHKAADQGNANLGPRSTEIPLKKQGGVYELPVKINGAITLNFVLDTGASEVTIPADVALTLLRTGTITQRDFLPGKSYQLADGSTVQSPRFILRELDLGGIKITQVQASIASATAPLLLGQSFLGRLGSWEMDNNRHVLIIRGVR